MFRNRYITRGISLEIPLELQLFLWDCIDKLSDPKDYLQVFRLSDFNGKQRIVHHQEVPEYKKEYLLKVSETVNTKIFVIDDGEYCTMLLSEEY